AQFLGCRRRRRKASTSPKKHVVNKHCEAFARERVSKGTAAIIGIAEGLDGRECATGTVGDLLLPEELVVAVIIERDNAGEWSKRAWRFQGPGMRSRSESDHPRELFTIQPVGPPAARHLNIARPLLFQRATAEPGAL